MVNFEPEAASQPGLLFCFVCGVSNQMRPGRPHQNWSTSALCTHEEKHTRHTNDVTGYMYSNAKHSTRSYIDGKQTKLSGQEIPSVTPRVRAHQTPPD